MGGAIKLHEAAHVHLVGNSDCWHPQFRHSIQNRLSFIEAIHHRIVTVHPQVYKLRRSRLNTSVSHVLLHYLPAKPEPQV